MTLQERIKAEAKLRRGNYPGKRLGQVVTAVALYQPGCWDIVEQLKDTEFDCYEDDSKIDAFLNEVARRAAEE